MLISVLMLLWAGGVVSVIWRAGREREVRRESASVCKGILVHSIVISHLNIKNIIIIEIVSSSKYLHLNVVQQQRLI